MAVYVVGDIQGCYKPFKALLKQVGFNPEVDVLWCCGDVVNRGPDSLKVLRYLKSLGDACILVLGNHDLQLLAYAAGGKSFPGDTLDEVLEAEDAAELIDWLRFRPMMHHDKDLNWTMVHAGLSPLWTLKKARKRARKIEKILRSPEWPKFCRKLQKKSYPVSDTKDKQERKFFSISVFTRTRYCSSQGVFDWSNKTSNSKDKAIKPWFSHAKAKWKKEGRIVYGHWAAKGLVTKNPHVLGLDTGCVWGGSLTIAKLGADKTFHLYHQSCKTAKA